MPSQQIRYTFPRQPSRNAFDAFLDKLPYCSRQILGASADRATRAWVDVALEAGADADEVRAKLDDFFAKVVRGCFELSPDTLVDRRETTTPNSEPVLSTLFERRWLLPLAPGCVGMQGPALALYHYFDRRFTEIAREFAAVEMSFPALISIDTLNTARYLTSFPHHITLAPHLIGDIEAIDSFQRNVVADETGDLLRSAAQPDHVLSPTVCIHCYQAIQGRVLAQGEMLRVTAAGNCFRHELGRLDHGTRLWDFNMREIIFIGTRADVGAARRCTVELVSAWLDELGMSYWIETASDPFFVDNYSAQSFFQLANKTKYELLVALPGSDRPVAIGSFNVHHDFFGRAFSITLPGGEQAADTGCTAIGLERFVLGFLSQFGLDPGDWPGQVRGGLATYNLGCL